MAQSNILREFLVALGYKVDESSQKKFIGGITTATKAVMRLGTVMEGTALAVAYGVARFASNLEQLYFASQRTHSSADSLKAFDLAARNFGASIDEAQGSVEGLAAFLRNNPGGANVIAGWLGAVGLSARGANGQLLEGTALMAQLGKMFAIQRQQGHTFLANQMAGQLGISDKTMLAISDPGFAAEVERQERRAAGWAKVSAAAHRFMIQFEDLKMRFLQMMLGFEGPAMGALQRLMTQFGRFLQHHGKQAIHDLVAAFQVLIGILGKLLDWLDAHGDEIQRRILQTFTQFKSAYEIVKPAMVWVYDQFVALDKATDGWSTKLIALTVALKAVGATGIITGIASLGAGLAKAFGGLIGSAVTAVGGFGSWTVAGTAFGVAAAAAIGAAIGTIAYNLMPEWLQRKLGDAEGHAVDAAASWYEDQKSKFREFHAAAVYSSHPNRGALDAQYSPHFETNVNVTVHGGLGGDPHKVAGYVASAAEREVRKQADLTREFLATVR